MGGRQRVLLLGGEIGERHFVVLHRDKINRFSGLEWPFLLERTRSKCALPAVPEHLNLFLFSFVYFMFYSAIPSSILIPMPDPREDQFFS
jgi:hypothetical protein